MPHAAQAGIRRIRDATDLGSTPGAGNDGYVLTWNNSTSAFVLSAGGGGSGSPGGSTTQVQYNNAGAFAGDAGLTYNASTDRLTVVGGIVAPSMRPASDSATALQLTTAAGTAVVTVNTVTRHVITPFLTAGDELSGFSGVYNFVCNGWDAGIFLNRLGGNPAFIRLTVDSAGGGQLRGLTTGGFAFTNNSSSVEWGRFTNDGYLAVGQTSATALIDLAASTTARASLRIRSGTAPTSPNDGDIWFNGTAFQCRIGGVTRTFTVT